MRIEFAESIPLSASDIYAYFQSPQDWGRLYGFGGTVRDRGDGWFVVPLARFPFPLVARITAAEPERLVRWTFGGAWRGSGEVRLIPRPHDVLVEGYEEIRLRWLPGLAVLLETLFMERRFRRIWERGWRRLRRQAASAAAGPATGG